MKVTIGADPEFFVRKLYADKFMLVDELEAPQKGKKKQTLDPEYVWKPICGLLGGTKLEPQQIQGLPKGYTQQEDGAAVEFNIPPADNVEDFQKSIVRTVRHLGKLLTSKGLEPRWDLRTIELGNEVLEKFPNLASIGCDPDFSAYKNVGQPRGQIPAEISRVRGAGGHLHIGYDKNVIPASFLVQFLDLTITLPMLRFDVQGKRRGWWGMPGIYRNKPYGLEYRSLSNFWIANDILCYGIGKQVFELLDSLERNMIAWQEMYNLCNWDLVQLHIQNENSSEGNKYLETLCARSKVLSDLIKGLRSIV